MRARRLAFPFLLSAMACTQATTDPTLGGVVSQVDGGSSREDGPGDASSGQEADAGPGVPSDSSDAADCAAIPSKLGPGVLGPDGVNQTFFQMAAQCGYRIAVFNGVTKTDPRLRNWHFSASAEAAARYALDLSAIVTLDDVLMVAVHDREATGPASVNIVADDPALCDVVTRQVTWSGTEARAGFIQLSSIVANREPVEDSRVAAACTNGRVVTIEVAGNASTLGSAFVVPFEFARMVGTTANLLKTGVLRVDPTAFAEGFKVAIPRSSLTADQDYRLEFFGGAATVNGTCSSVEASLRFAHQEQPVELTAAWQISALPANFAWACSKSKTPTKTVTAGLVVLN